MKETSLKRLNTIQFILYDILGKNKTKETVKLSVLIRNWELWDNDEQTEYFWGSKNTV